MEHVLFPSLYFTAIFMQLEGLYTTLSEKAKVLDVVTATEPSKVRSIWELRELVFEAVRKVPGVLYRYPFALVLDL